MPIEAQINVGVDLTSPHPVFIKTTNATTAGYYSLLAEIGSAVNPLDSGEASLTFKLVRDNGTDRRVIGEASVSKPELETDPAEHGVEIPLDSFGFQANSGDDIELYLSSNNANDDEVDVIITPRRIADVTSTGNVESDLQAISGKLADGTPSETDRPELHLKTMTIDNPDSGGVGLSIAGQTVGLECIGIYGDAARLYTYNYGGNGRALTIETEGILVPDLQIGGYDLRGAHVVEVFQAWVLGGSLYAALGNCATRDQLDAALWAQTRFRMSIPEKVERPESGTVDFTFGISTFDRDGALADCDGTPSVHAFYQDGSSADAKLGTVTKPDGTTGLYTFTFAVAYDDPDYAHIRFVGSADQNGDPIGMTDYTQIVDDASPDFTADDRQTLNSIPSNPLLSNDTRIPAAAPPTVAQFEARTKPTADYADKATIDSIAAAVGTLTPAERETLADVILGRSVAESEGTAAAVSLVTFLLAAVNKANTSDNPGFLTVYRTDGVTEHARIPVSPAPGAIPINGVG